MGNPVTIPFNNRHTRFCMSWNGIRLLLESLFPAPEWKSLAHCTVLETFCSSCGCFFLAHLCPCTVSSHASLSVGLSVRLSVTRPKLLEKKGQGRHVKKTLGHKRSGSKIKVTINVKEKAGGLRSTSSCFINCTYMSLLNELALWPQLYVWIRMDVCKDQPITVFLLLIFSTQTKYVMLLTMIAVKSCSVHCFNGRLTDVMKKIERGKKC